MLIPRILSIKTYYTLFYIYVKPDNNYEDLIIYLIFGFLCMITLKISLTNIIRNVKKIFLIGVLNMKGPPPLWLLCIKSNK